MTARNSDAYMQGVMWIRRGINGAQSIEPVAKPSTCSAERMPPLQLTELRSEVIRSILSLTQPLKAWELGNLGG